MNCWARLNACFIRFTLQIKNLMSKNSMWLLHSIQKTYEYLLVRPYICKKNTSDMPKLHTFLRLHVSDYKISGTTSARPCCGPNMHFETIIKT